MNARHTAPGRSGSRSPNTSRHAATTAPQWVTKYVK